MGGVVPWVRAAVGPEAAQAVACLLAVAGWAWQAFSAAAAFGWVFDKLTRREG